MIERQDLFGEHISLNYQGRDAYKTCPGGLMSCFFNVFMLLFIIYKVDDMSTNAEWTLMQQEIRAPNKALEFEHKL